MEGNVSSFPIIEDRSLRKAVTIAQDFSGKGLRFFPGLRPEKGALRAVVLEADMRQHVD